MQQLNSDAEPPSVSAIVLCYNHEAYIGDCVLSLLEKQTGETQIVVLDDHSSDASAKIVAEIEQRVDNVRLIVNETNTGDVAGNTQKLIDATASKYILFMAGDDMLAPSYDLHAAVEIMEADRNVGAVIPRLAFMSTDEAGLQPTIYDASLLASLRSSDPHQVMRQHLFRRVSRLFLQGVVLRRALVEDMGGFVSGVTSDDYAFFMRLFAHLCQTGRTFHFSEASEWLYRIHSSNIHRNPVRQFTSILEVVSRYVPQSSWAQFKWDGVTFTEYRDLDAAVQLARVTLGNADSRRLVRKISRLAVSAAARRRDPSLLRHVLRDPRVPTIIRAKAAFKLMRLS